MSNRAESILLELINVVEYWMEYMRHVVKSPNLLVEHSVCIPISEYLERLNDVNFELEKKHDKLQKKRVDVYWEFENEKNYLELKLAKGYSSEVLSDYFDDLCRLSLLCNQQTHCYFLLTGNIDGFDTMFYNTRSQKRRKRKSCAWLSLDGSSEERTIITQEGHTNNKIKTQNNKIIDCYKSYINEYKTSYSAKQENGLLEDAMSTFKTKLIYYNVKENNSIFKKNKTALWEIYRDDANNESHQ